jgi:hypothetical protein
MPYIPDECFNLIKKFAGIHPARYHHNKIAAMIENRLTCLGEAWRCGKVVPHIPLVYEIIYLEEWCHDWQDGLDCVGDKDYHETRKTLDEVRFKLVYRLYLIAWNKTYRHLTQNHVWLKITTKIETATSRRLINNGWLIRTCCNTASRDSCEHLYVPELKQLCEENNIPQKLYSNITRIGLISLIQHYNFEDS